MTKGTIVYVGGFELPDKNAAAHRVINNGKLLREYGYKVVFIDIDKTLPYKKHISMNKKETQNFEYWSRPYPKSKKEWIHYLCDADSIIRILTQYKDLKAVICYNYQSISFMKLKKYCNRNHIKIFADCTEWYSTKGASIIFKIIKGFDSFIRMRILQKRLDGLIVISSYLSTYYQDCKNVVQIPPLVDLTEEKWRTDSTNSNDNRINLVYAGSPGRNKDCLDFIIEVLYELNEVSNFTFNIIGITKDQYLKDNKNHKDIIERLGKKVVFYGRLSHQESLKYIKLADFSIFIRENSRMNNAGFPTKFVESISVGTPIITNETSDLKGFLIEEKNGFYLNTHNKKSMISKLYKILTLNKNTIKKMKQICYNSRMFHYEKYKKNIEAIIKECEK